ncbi:MAG: NADP-dependent isocitrate dehydrogenase [Campylobacter sp.]
MSEIIWTKTDEAPMLSTYSLLPILRSFLQICGIDLKSVDISLCARILAAFKKGNDDLEFLSKLTGQKDANIIKLPNISASLPQLNAAISELNLKGFNLPPYDENSAKIYQKVLGSAVNPVLREGNSDRRSVKAVKEFAKANPHRMGEWSDKNKAEVSSMKSGDFYGNECSIIADFDDTLSINFIDKTGEKTLLKSGIEVRKGDIIDASFMSAKELKKFAKEQIEEAKKKDLLFSLHLKASMMKISDPVIFGHFVREFFAEIFTDFKDEFDSIGVNANNGLKDLFEKIKALNRQKQEEILSRFDEAYKSAPQLMMISKDITNLHVPSDTIIDASMPNMIRNSGKMYGKDGLKECKAVIPDRTYAVVYETVINDFKANGALDPSKIGSVANVGLMAKKAEEYGSHDKTFVINKDGEVIVTKSNNEEIFRFKIENGDIFRMTKANDEAIDDWVKLAVKRAKISGQKAIFWLDSNRAHDAKMIQKVTQILADCDTKGLDIEILNLKQACEKTLEIIRHGDDCISVTGNVLRDYLTDLFPILEFGTSSKMLSVVPLLCGGAIFETGAGGTAPRLVDTFLEQNYLAWDSLGEFLALIASLQKLGESEKNAEILAKTLENAVKIWLENNKSPFENSSKIDNRVSHFYMALYWANELSKDEILGDKFKKFAEILKQNEEKILAEFNESFKKPPQLGGYYKFDEKMANNAMRASVTFNEILKEMR